MFVSCECCNVEVSATGWSLVQRSPTDCGMSECDRESSIKWRPWPTGGCWGVANKQNPYTTHFCVLVESRICLDFLFPYYYYYNYYACPITLGNTTCWVMIGCTSVSILRCVTLYCSELICFHLCYSESKSIKVMNGFRIFVINSFSLIVFLDKSVGSVFVLVNWLSNLYNIFCTVNTQHTPNKMQ